MACKEKKTGKGIKKQLKFPPRKGRDRGCDERIIQRYSERSL
jgi:hypothetical protein